jgi:hypothetical protein
MNHLKVISAEVLLLMVLLFQTPLYASSESEPNDTPATATPLTDKVTMNGEIKPVGDSDYYIIDGVNTTWGFIALLDTSVSTASKAGVITVLRNDGMTVLQTDSGSWEKGSGIALQNYADGSQDHYITVHEQGDDDAISPYNLRYYKTVVRTQPEVEPNDSLSTGTTSSFTMSGAIDSADDEDYFLFHGRTGDNVIIALNTDPEKDGTAADLVLSLVSPLGEILKSANLSGAGGNEFIEYTDLPSEGAYAYRVTAVSGWGADATYTAGIVRNGSLYTLDYGLDITWVNKPTDGIAEVGDLLTFRLSASNNSPLDLPGEITMQARWPESCLEFVSSSPSETPTTSGQLDWSESKEGLDAGETYSVEITLRATADCSENVNQSAYFSYIFTGAGRKADFQIGGASEEPPDDDDTDDDTDDDVSGGGSGGGCFISSVSGNR